jgi:hypothetical protein
LRLCSRQAGADAFPDAGPLELRDCREEVQLQPAGGRPGVDAFVQAGERDIRPPSSRFPRAAGIP